MSGRRQPGLFDECDPPADLPPPELHPAAAFEFYRRTIGEPTLHRGRVYAEFGRGRLPPPADADWFAMAAVLLGDRPASRPARERVTVLVGDFERGVRYEVARRGGIEKLAADAAGRFLCVVHSAYGLTAICRLIDGRDCARLTARWADEAAAHFARPGRRVWRADAPWEYLASRGERVLKIRDGALAYPN